MMGSVVISARSEKTGRRMWPTSKRSVSFAQSCFLTKLVASGSTASELYATDERFESQPRVIEDFRGIILVPPERCEEITSSWAMTVSFN
jgi:hypothetical protein